MKSTINDLTIASAADAAEKLCSRANQLRDWLVEHEAPAKCCRVSELLVDGATQVRGTLQSVAQDSGSEKAAFSSNLSHRFGNELNLVYQPLQRLQRMDSDTTLDSMREPLADIAESYNIVANFAEHASMNSSVEATESEIDQPAQPVGEDSTPSLRPEDTGRVLIVDDDWKACQVLEETLEDHGHVVTSCRRPERVLELLREGAFDVCLLDVNMPKMSGWDLLQCIKSDPRTTHTSVIVVSGTNKQENATRAIRSGADDFISKPVNVSLLSARITNCLSRSRLHLRELTRFLPQSVVDVIRREPNRLKQGHEATVTVMFCDIRRFSKFSERMSPSETIRWISDVMEALSKRILEDGGTLIDFVGDEVLAMWGAPQPSGNHAESACRCALRIQETVSVLSERWADVLGEPMEVGIGIHSGIVSVGNTGSPQRFKYGPLGNTVNLGSRVQGASKYLRSRILVTRDTRRQLPRNLRVRRLCSVRVMNIDRPVELYELATDASQRAKKRDHDYEEALMGFEAGNFARSIAGLARLLSKDPDDGPSLLLMNRLIEAKLQGDSDFDPIWQLPGK
ncbi:MAG: response regulator [Rubripirellula sp.]